MEREWKLSVSKWHDLTPEGKDMLRNWAVKHGYELDLIPGGSANFDPTCEYAALLTQEQMKAFLEENKQEISQNSTGEQMWRRIRKLLKQL